MSGKRKKGGIWVEESTILCEITCDDGSIYKIAACIRARLLEVNLRLLEEPELLNTKVDSLQLSRCNALASHGRFYRFVCSESGRCDEYSKVAADLRRVHSLFQGPAGDGIVCIVVLWLFSMSVCLIETTFSFFRCLLHVRSSRRTKTILILRRIKK